MVLLSKEKNEEDDMKKRVLSQIVLFLVLLSGLLFTGCENFLNGEEIKDAVVEAIQYGNAPYYTIRIEAVKGSGTIKGNEEVSKRVSDTFSVRFDPEEDHTFIKWEAVIPNLGSGESIADYIVFEDAESLETNVTLKKANSNILIRPVCPAKLKVSINLSADEKKGYPRDSAIALTFTEEIADECLNNISINISDLPEGKTFRDYYKAPEKSGNLVIFNPKIDWENVNENDLIPMEEGELKTITVQLPLSQIFYENADYSSNIVQYLEDNSKFPFTFTINSKINEAPEIDVNIEGSHGYFTPGKGKYTVQQFQKNQILFEPEGDYGFIRWQIYNMETDEEIPDGLYIKLEDPEAQKTSYTLIQLPENSSGNQVTDEENEGEEEDVNSNIITLAIRPVVCERPQVISNSPVYSSSGVLRDTTIQVMFDYDMDETSIYYTSPEIAELVLQNVELLNTKTDRTGNWYGYTKNGETFFKNISIINSRNGANLNDKFKPPVFDNPRTLTIPVAEELSAGLNIQVTIEKDFHRSQNGKPVSMNQAKKWLYLVNGQADTTAPEINNIIVKDSSENEITAGNAPVVSSSNVNSLKFFGAGKFYLGLAVHDNTVPAQSFTVNLTKIYDASYTAVTPPVTYSKPIYYTTAYGDTAVYGTESGGTVSPALCELTDVKDLTDGVYGLSITAKDGSGNSVTSPAASDGLYYFCLDNTKPNIAAPTVSIDDTTASSIKLNWITTGATDYKETKFRYRKWGSTGAYTETSATSGNTYTISALEAGTHYEIIADYYDYAGNVNKLPVKTNNSINGAYTRPAKPKSVTLNANYGTSVRVTAVKPDNGNCTNMRIRYKLHDGTSWNEFGSRIIIDAETGSGYQIITPSKGYKWDFEVCTYDSASGLYSDPYSTSTSGTTYPLFTSAPNAPSAFVLDTRSTNSLTIKWSAPSSGNYSGYIVDCSTGNTFDSSNNEVIQTNTITSGSTLTTTFNDLTPGTIYYFRISSYYVTQNNKTAYTTGGYYIKCAPATGLSATSISNSSMKVTWTAPVGGFSSYKLYYKKSTDSSYSSYVNVNKSLTEATVTGLSGGISYDFRLVTIGEVDAQQNSIDATGYKNHPNPVQNLKAIKVSGSNTNYTLSWTKPGSGEYDGYKYYIASSVAGLSSASPTTVLKTTESSGNISLSKSATANSVVYIKVVTYRTVNGSELKTESTPICCSLALDSVQSLTATAASKTQINLSWTNPLSSGYDGIRVYRGSTLLAATDATGSTPTISKSATSYSATGLTVNTNYNFTITTYKKDTATNVTLTADNIVSRYTLSNPLTSFTASANGPKSVSLSWTYPASETYNTMYIYRGSEYVDYWSSQTSSNYSVPAGGTSYTFKVVTRNGNAVENTSEAKTYTLTTPPEPVTNLSASQNSSYPNTRIDLSWTKPGGNYTGVKVYYKISSDSSYSLYNTYANNTTTSCAVTGLIAGYTYDFKVESYLSNVSNIGSTSAATKSCSTKPYVASFYLSSRSYNSITYAWSKPSGYVGGYYLYYKKSSDSSWSSVSLSSSATSYSINTEGGKIYNAYIVTYGSSTSNTATSTTLTKATPLATPGSFSVSKDGTGVKVSWASPSNASSSTTTYYLYYKLSSGSWTYKTTTNTYYTFANTDLTGGGLYYFYVYASNYINSETLTSVSTDTKSIYAPPRAITFSTNPYIYQDDAMGTVTIRWVNDTGRSDITGIKIYYDDVYYSAISFSNGSAQTKTITISNYVRGSSHYFRFEPYHNKNGSSTSDWTVGPKTSYNLSTSSGNLKINGTSYSYSTLSNVITSQVYINDTTNAHDDGAYFKNREVYLSPYSMGAYEVTQELYNAIMGANPSSSNYWCYPVNNVSYYHAIAFCNKLSVLQGLDPCYYISGYSDSYWGTITHSDVPTSNNNTWNAATLRDWAKGYRLPTEAEHEFAARGGMYCLNGYGNMVYTSTPWTYAYPGSNTLKNVAWIKDNSSSSLHYVGLKPANALGLYDMSGSVTEWLSDWNYNPTTGTYYNPYCGYSTSNSSGSYSGGTINARSEILKKEAKVLKKGGWYGSNDNAWVDSNGDKWEAYKRDQSTGFRICRWKTYN